MSGLYALLPGLPDFDPAVFKVSSLCKRGHDWMGTGQSLRYLKSSHCVECEKERGTQRGEYRRRYYEANAEKERQAAKDRQAVRRQDPEQRRLLNERSRLCQSNRRATRGESRSHLGLPYKFFEQHGLIRRLGAMVADMHNAGLSPDAIKETLLIREQILSRVGHSQTVAQLVAAAQHEYWSENPDAYHKYTKQQNRERNRWRWMTDESYRLYHRQKTRRRKAQMRDSVAIQIKGRQVRERFRQFDNRCAYCGCTGDLHIEHVVPISKGGPHAMGNIIPACKNCNFSKAAHEAESWYRTQPFFSELRWRKICRVLEWGRSSVGQLALL